MKAIVLDTLGAANRALALMNARARLDSIRGTRKGTGRHVDRAHVTSLARVEKHPSLSLWSVAIVNVAAWEEVRQDIAAKIAANTATPDERKIANAIPAKLDATWTRKAPK